jgi:hypothetical protein
VKIHEQITPETWRHYGLYDSRSPHRLDMTEWLFKLYPAPHTLGHWLKLCAAIGVSRQGPWGSLSFWQDARERTFDEVKAAFKKADL